MSTEKIEWPDRYPFRPARRERRDSWIAEVTRWLPVVWIGAVGWIFGNTAAVAAVVAWALTLLFSYFDHSTRSARSARERLRRDEEAEERRLRRERGKR